MLKILQDLEQDAQCMCEVCKDEIAVTLVEADGRALRVCDGCLDDLYLDRME
jgi:ribosome-binding protein aMBF1 (putative translation factor)